MTDQGETLPATPAEAVRDDRYYRFSVKCDRETSAKITEAAQFFGMSPTSFVQAHFEEILSWSPKPKVRR